MLRLPVIVLGILLTRLTSFGHEVWVTAHEADDAGMIQVILACGHRFPSSSFAVADRVVRAVTLTSPDGNVLEVSTAITGEARTGRVPIQSEGLHLLTAMLQRPRQIEPHGWSRMWIHRGDIEPVEIPVVGNGLEIRVISRWEALRVGQELQVVVLRDGQPVAASGTVFSPDGTTRRLHVSDDEPTVLTLSQSGLLLLSIREGGQFSNLTLAIAEE